MINKLLKLCFGLNLFFALSILLASLNNSSDFAIGIMWIIVLYIFPIITIPAYILGTVFILIELSITWIKKRYLNFLLKIAYLALNFGIPAYIISTPFVNNYSLDLRNTNFNFLYFTSFSAMITNIFIVYIFLFMSLYFWINRKTFGQSEIIK